MSAETTSHLQEAEHFLTKAEDVRTAHQFAGDRNAAASPLAMIAQAHATLALVQTLNDIQDQRALLTVDTY